MSLPASARHAQGLKGSTTPRVYTPPLQQHCNSSAAVQCICGCGLHPESSWGFECIDFIEKVLGWTLIPYQKWLYVHSLERDELLGNGFRFDTILVLIARQNGKTQWLKGLGLWKLYVDGAKAVLLTAQKLDVAETTLTEVVASVKANKLLMREFRQFVKTNGKYKLVLKPLSNSPADEPREWRTQVSGRKGGRSFSIDCAMLDELREHQNWKGWDAITATTTARPRSLTVCASNAGDVTSVVLQSLRDGAIAKILTKETAETQIFLAEWSVPEDADPLDSQFWPMANPAMGYLFGEQKLSAKCESMQKDNLAGWKTEHLCQWVLVLEPGIIPAEHWSATLDETSCRAEDAAVFAGLDVNFERSQWYAGVWSRRSDGDAHFEVAHAERGTEGVVAWFAERIDRFKCVVVQARGAPASGLIEDLVAAGVNVVELGGPDLTKAYGNFYDEIVTHTAWHRSSPVLDAAAEGAQARPIGDAWAIDRKNSPVDPSPLVACIQAAAGEWLYAEPKEIEVWGFVS